MFFILRIVQIFTLNPCFIIHYPENMFDRNETTY